MTFDATDITTIGKDRISGAETVCGTKSYATINEILDVYLMNSSDGPTVAGSSRNTNYPLYDKPLFVTGTPNAHVFDGLTTVTLADHSTITFASIDDFDDGNPIASE
jgi:hypothetical protein